MTDTPLNTLSIFIIGLYDTDDLQSNLVGQFADAPGRAIKVHGSGSQMNYAAKKGLFVIGRDITHLEEPLANEKPGAATARKWFETLFLPWVSRYGQHMHEVYFQGRVNEPGNLEPPKKPDDFDYLVAYAEEEAERARLMAAEGYLACLGNFSAEARIGLDKASRVLEMTRASVKYNGVIGLDAYGSPSMLDPAVHEFVYPEELLAASLIRLGEPVPAMVNPELGIDDIISLSRWYPGWRTVGISGYDFMAQVVEVNKRKRAMGLVKASFVFVDDYNPSSGWEKYNTHGGRPARPKQNDPGEPAVTTMILNYHRDNPDVPITRPSTPAPQPEPEPTIPQPGYAGTAVATDYLRVRAGAGTSHNVLRVLSPGEPIRLIGEQASGFARIEAGLNLTGEIADGIKPIKAWASAQYLSIGG